MNTAPARPAALRLRNSGFSTDLTSRVISPIPKHRKHAMKNKGLPSVNRPEIAPRSRGVTAAITPPQTRFPAPTLTKSTGDGII